MFRTLTPIFSILIAITAYFYYIQPTMGEIKDIQNETSEYAEAVNSAGQFNALLQKLVQQRNSFSAIEVERLETLVPNMVDEVRLLVDLKEITRRRGMLFGNISVSEGEGSTDLQTNETLGVRDLNLERDFTYSDISFDLIGTYEQFRDVLADVENSLVLMEVMDISFVSGVGDLEQYNITVRAYALKPLSS